MKAQKVEVVGLRLSDIAEVARNRQPHIDGVKQAPENQVYVNSASINDAQTNIWEYKVENWSNTDISSRGPFDFAEALEYIKREARDPVRVTFFPDCIIIREVE